MITELFRHDKKFYHETAISIKVSDALSEEEIADRTKKINDLVFVRVGLEYRIQAVAVENASGDADKFAAAVGTIVKNSESAFGINVR